MTSRQLKIQALGGARESFSEALLGLIASMVPVGREHDYGIDYYCLPRQELDKQTETVADICGIQVKGESRDALTFGGLSSKALWKDYELQWLQNLPTPLYVATVDDSFERLNLYSTVRTLSVFWKTGMPFRVDCTIRPPEFSIPVSVQEPSPKNCEPSPHGDGQVWEVDLGPPFLSLTFKELTDKEWRSRSAAILRRWILSDRWSIIQISLGIPRFKVIQDYTTNDPTPHPIEQHWMYWQPSGSNLDKIAEVLVPGIVVMVRTLLARRLKEEAQQWASPLRWCLSHGWLEVFGREALKELDG